METTIIINEQHSLLPEQELILEAYPKYESLLVPATGWTRVQMDEIMENLVDRIIFISPIPYMIKNLAEDAMINFIKRGNPGIGNGFSKVEVVKVMCNDKREKKELPNGKIISVTAKEGWYLA